MSMRIYTGDLEPALEITLSDKTGAAVDATSATEVRVIGTLAGTEIFDREATTVVVDGDTTVVTMDWETGDTDDAGRILIEVEVLWPGNRPQTFRPGAVAVVTDHDAI